MHDDLPKEQIAHDLAIAFAQYSLSKDSDKRYDVQEFYQEYTNAYAVFLPLVERNN